MRPSSHDDPSREVWIVGQELHNYATIWSGPFVWNFEPLLPRILQRLSSNPKEKAFLFGSSEPQQLPDPRVGSEGAAAIRVVPIPVINVVFCEAAVPSLLGITSVQSSEERVAVDMKELKMGWTPWRPADHCSRRQRVSSPAAERIFVLACTLRHFGRGQYLSEGRLKRFEYAMPWLVRSKDVMDEPEPVTDVVVCYASPGGARLEFGFDKEVDRTQLLIPELIEEHGLQESEFETIKESIKAAFAAKRAEQTAKHEQLKAFLAGLGEQARAALDAAVILKVYPQNREIGDSLKTSFINRYYGHAHEVV